MGAPSAPLISLLSRGYGYRRKSARRRVGLLPTLLHLTAPFATVSADKMRFSREWLQLLEDRLLECLGCL
jgi:hypothetical protein